MRLHAVLLIMSVVLADDADLGDESHQVCVEDACHPDYEDEVTFEKNSDGHMVLLNESESLPDRTNGIAQSTSFPVSGLYNFSSSDISCIITSSFHDIKCSWSTSALPKEAQYSASIHLCREDGSHQLTHFLNCSLNSKKEQVECQKQIPPAVFLMFQVNISIPSHWYTICKKYEAALIEILDPPEMSVTAKSNGLEINWSLPKSAHTHNRDCFVYQLKINNDIVNLSGVSIYTRKNIDPTQSYSIQIRAAVDAVCVSSVRWSAWSEIKVIGPSENPYHLNVWVILSVILVLPMILLAFLLVCKFQRLSEKLFPSIPSPSVKVKKLLEKDDFSQVMPPKHAESGAEVEEVTEIFQVAN